MRVAGIDPSLTSTGLALVDNGFITDLQNVKSSTTGHHPFEVVDRINSVATDVLDWIDRSEPDLIVIESASYASKFGKPHERAGLYWTLVDGALLMGDRLVPVAPQSRAKYATGRGNAKKADVLKAVREEYQPLTDLKIRNDDIADALILASMGSRVLGYPVEAKRPSESRLEALRRVYEYVK